MTGSGIYFFYKVEHSIANGLIPYYNQPLNWYTNVEVL